VNPPDQHDGPRGILRGQVVDQFGIEPLGDNDEIRIADYVPKYKTIDGDR
jgi:hypothetical protein